MSGNHDETKNHNLEFLTDILGLKQIKPNSTTVFEKDDIFVLSPAVGKGKNWFDIRDVNLNYFDKKNYSTGFLVLRIADGDKFILVELKNLMKIMGDKARYTRGVKTWGLKFTGIENIIDTENEKCSNVFVYNALDINNSIQTVLLNKDEVITILEDYLAINVN